MHFPHALSLSFLLAFLGACGGSSGPAAPPPAAWSEPTVIHTFDLTGGPGMIFVEGLQPDAEGGLTVMWPGPGPGQPGPGRIVPSFLHRQPTGTWALVPPISADACCSYQAWTMGASGVESVLIGKGEPEGNTTLTSTRFAAGTWSAPAPVASSVRVVNSNAQQAVYDAQRRLAYSPLGAGDILHWPAVTRYDPDAGGWQPVEELSRFPEAVQVWATPGAISADGRMIATWWTRVNDEIKLVYYTFRPGTGWSAAAAMPGIQSFSLLKIMAGDGGNFLVVHLRRTGDLDEMLLSRFNVDTGWESPVVVASGLARTATGQLMPMDVHRGEGGHILAAWTQSKELAPGGSVVPEPRSRFYDPATGWAPSVTAPEVKVGNAVRISPSGKVIVASESGISTLDASGNWVTVDPLPPRQPVLGNNGVPSFVIEPSGAVTAVWTKFEWTESATNRLSLMSSTYR